MQIPSIFYGNYRAVRKNARELAHAFIEGRDVHPLVEDTIDPATVSGWLVLDEPRHQLQGGSRCTAAAIASPLGSAISRIEYSRPHL